MRPSGMLFIVAGSLVASTAVAAEPTDDRAYAAELKADAAARSSALEESGVLAEGDSSVKLGGWFQFRYYLNFREDPGDGGSFHDSGFTNGFESTKTRLLATGNVLDKALTFRVEGEFSKNGGTFGLLDAYVNYAYENGWSARVGQFKLPLLRQELVSDTAQLGTGRTLTNDIFSQRRSQGIQGQWNNEAWMVRVALSDGLSTQNTPYTSPAEGDIAVTGRVDWRGGADSWSRFDTFHSWQGSENAWLAGAALHWQHNGNTASTGSPVQQSIIQYTADFGFEGDGWNAYAALIGRHIDADGPGESLDDFGANIQGGVFVHQNAEVFGAWDAVFPDSDYGSSMDTDFHTATAGVNVYPFEKSNAVKFTGQVSWFINAPAENALVAPASSSNNVGLRPSGEDNQFAVIFQLQVVF